MYRGLNKLRVYFGFAFYSQMLVNFAEHVENQLFAVSQFHFKNPFSLSQSSKRRSIKFIMERPSASAAFLSAAFVAGFNRIAVTTLTSFFGLLGLTILLSAY
jgi:hypothetical protein